MLKETIGTEQRRRRRLPSLQQSYLVVPGNLRQWNVPSSLPPPRHHRQQNQAADSRVQAAVSALVRTSSLK